MKKFLLSFHYFSFYLVKKIKIHLPDIELKAITADFTHWWQYFNSDIDLSSDFIAYDSSSNKIENYNLEELTTGGLFQ
jgi:hypothetical protein